MKNLKVRAWDGARFEVWDVTGDFNDDKYHMLLNASAQTNTDLMLYTGLKDKNGFGIELYEDDIVKCSGHGVGRVGQNCWGEWCVFFPEQYKGEGAYDIPIHDLVMEQDLGQIVGTIHENPELLEVDV